MTHLILPDQIMTVEEIEIDQIGPLPPADIKKEIVYHEVTFYFGNGKDRFFYNCEQIDGIEEEFQRAINEGRLFKWKYKGGVDFFNPIEITHISTRKQKGKKKNRWVYEDESLNPKRDYSF